MSSKTPFEIRKELLQIAQSICIDKMHAERQRLENDWYLKRDEWNFRLSNNDFVERPSFPTVPFVSTEEVIAEAKKLNEFISNG
jgi:hypothetical protein